MLLVVQVSVRHIISILSFVIIELIKSGLLLSDCVLSRDILSSLEFSCHIVMVFPVLVDYGVEDIDCDMVVILVLVVIFLGSVELICSVGGILSVCLMGLVTDGLCLSFLNK